MKLSLELLARELTLRNRSIQLFGNHESISAMQYSGYSLLQASPLFTSSFIYLSDLPPTTEQAEELRKSNSALLLFGCEPNSVPFGIGTLLCFDVIPTNKKEYIRHISRDLSNIFDHFEDWQQQLFSQSCLGDIQKALDISYPILHRPLHFFVDKAVGDIAIAGPTNYKGQPKEMANFSVMSRQFSNSFSKDSMYFHDAFLFPKGVIEVDTLCYNIFSNNTFSARIICSPLSAEDVFLSCDYTLITILGRAIQYAYTEPTESVYEANHDVIPFFTDLISGNPINKVVLQYSLSSRGWVNGYFTVIYLCVNREKSQYKRNCQYLCRILYDRFDNIIPFPYGDDIVIIHYGGESTPIDDFLSAFVEFTVNNDFQYGISNMSSELDNIAPMFRQARAAWLHIAEVSTNAAGFCFNDMAYHYILKNGISNYPPELLAAPELLRLRDYDTYNSSNYLETLYIYLSTGLNAVASSKALFIHHATMVYRLKRICEIGKIDFSNFNRLVYIYISYNILNITPEKTSS